MVAAENINRYGQQQTASRASAAYPQHLENQLIVSLICGDTSHVLGSPTCGLQAAPRSSTPLREPLVAVTGAPHDAASTTDM
jgi:hypothetical protein